MQEEMIQAHVDLVSSTHDTQSTLDTPEDVEKLDSTPNTGAPDGSILDQSMIPSNEVFDACDSIDARDSQMNLDIENEKNLNDVLNSAQSLEDTRVYESLSAQQA